MFVTSRHGFAAAAALLIGMAQPAAAADLNGMDYGGSIKDAPAPSVFSWTGFYVGGHLGGAWAKPKGDLGCDSITRLLGEGGDPDDNDAQLDCSDLESDRIDDGPNDGQRVDQFELDGDYIALTGSASSGTESGFIGGIQVGVNKQYGNWIVGLEADWSGFGDIKSTTTGAFDYFHDEDRDDLEDYEGTGVVSIRNELDWLATFRARMGSVLSSDGRLMGYITAGAAVAKVSNSMSASFDDNDGAGWCDECYFSDTRGGGTFYQFGGVIGAGAEYALTDRFTIGAEYLYVGLTGQRENAVTFYGDDGRAFDIEQKTGFDDIHSVRVKANLKFN